VTRLMIIRDSSRRLLLNKRGTGRPRPVPDFTTSSNDSSFVFGSLSFAPFVHTQTAIGRTAGPGARLCEPQQRGRLQTSSALAGPFLFCPAAAGHRPALLR